MSATDNDKVVESEVVYSLRDVTDVEQGQGGFVKSLKSEFFFSFTNSSKCQINSLY